MCCWRAPVAFPCSACCSALQRARSRLSRVQGTRNWLARATGGVGVHQVLDVGGRDTLEKALEILAYGGHVALIGGLGGYGSDIPTDSLMWINATASGIYVGSREHFEAMNAFISEHEIRPLIDRVFEFEEAPAAFDYMESGNFMGKIVIRL